MPKVTLVWVSKPNKPFKIFRIPKLVFYVGATGCVLFFILLAATAFLTRSYRSELMAYSQKATELEQLVQEKDRIISQQDSARNDTIRQREQLIAEKDAAIQNLRNELDLARGQLDQIRHVEIRIREFLGLGEVTEEPAQTHQGGMGSADEELEQYRQSLDAIPEAELYQPNFSEYSSDLLARLHELLDHLNEKRLSSLTLPSILPVQGEDVWLSSGFGWRRNPFTRGRQFHNGIDVAGSYKTPIIAPADGKVVAVERDRFLGNCLKIQHKDDLVTLYGHLYSVKVKKGQKVCRGQVIALMGNSGRSTGCHLHYSIIRNDEYVDPMNYVWDRTHDSLALSKVTDETF